MREAAVQLIARYAGHRTAAGLTAADIAEIRAIRARVAAIDPADIEAQRRLTSDGTAPGRLFDPDAYRLEDRELDAIFNDTITPILFGDCTAPSTDPLLILVGAQPGAGKSRAGAAARQRSKQHMVEIIGDDLRPYHPDFRDWRWHLPIASCQDAREV
ncbi:MAG TPA: zeta toxin family protein [Mycobacterium sp.]|nr:zeta toxin family protein [Mycobacterium sp.]HUH68975.1 zeta toxin family protein [Mycobacterium sp.]